MKVLKEPKLYVVIFGLLFFGLLKMYMDLRDDLHRCETDIYYVPGGDIEKSILEKQRDSLSSELFIKDVELGRYEIALEILKESNPKAHNEYLKIISTQTE
jgi:hypothetical protein